MAQISTHGYANGGPRRYETFRTAWCAVPGIDAADLDFRCREERQLRAAGLAGVYYAQGAADRDGDVWRARRHIGTAAEATIAGLVALAGAEAI